MAGERNKLSRIGGDSSPWNHFHKVVIESDEEVPNGQIVRKATVLASIFGADSGTRFGNTALHFACALRPTRIEVILMLLEQGADPSQPNGQGETALHIAAIHCSASVVRHLLCSPICDADARDDRGATALHWAADQAEEHALAVVELLLEAGADASIQDRKGDTAMHCAARAGRYDVYKALETKLAKWKIFNRSGFAPFHSACLAAQEDFIESYLEDHPGHEALVTRGDEETPLLLAVRSRSESAVMALTASPEGRQAVNADDSFGRTPYFLATTIGDRFMTALLKERGAREDLVVALDMPFRCSSDGSSSSDLSVRSLGSLPKMPSTARLVESLSEDEELRLQIVSQSPRKMAVDDVTTPGRCSPSTPPN